MLELINGQHLIIYLCLLLLIIVTLPQGLRRIRLMRWKKKWRINKHLITYHHLFQSVNGFLLSKKARQNQDAFEYVYGEIEFTSFIALLTMLRPDKKTVFFDLGSGVGKAVFACAMVFDIKKSCGIELFENLHAAAKNQHQQLKKHPDYYQKAKTIELIHQDFLSADFNDATIIFINATACIGKTWDRLCQRLEQIRPNTIVITTTKPLTSPRFYPIHHTMLMMSWGPVKAYIYKKKAQ